MCKLHDACTIFYIVGIFNIIVSLPLLFFDEFDAADNAAAEWSRLFKTWLVSKSLRGSSHGSLLSEKASVLFVLFFP